MDTARSAREPAETPRRTPGKNDFKRPKFALGRISFGDDEESSSCSSSSGQEDETPAPAAMPKSPLADGGRRTPLLAVGGKNGNKSSVDLAGRPVDERRRGAGRRSRGSVEAGALSSKRASASSPTLPLSAWRPIVLQDSSAGNIDRAAASRSAASAKGLPAAGAASSSGTISGVLVDRSLEENNCMGVFGGQQQHQQQSQASLRPSIGSVESNTRPSPARQSLRGAATKKEDDCVSCQGQRIGRWSHDEDRHSPVFGRQREDRCSIGNPALPISGGSATTTKVHTLDDVNNVGDGGGGGGGAGGSHLEKFPPSCTGRGPRGAAATAATEASATGTNSYSSSTRSSPPQRFGETSVLSDPCEEIEIPVDDHELFDNSFDEVVAYSPPPREATTTSSAATRCQASSRAGSTSSFAGSRSFVASPTGSSFFDRSLSPPPPPPFARSSDSHRSSGSLSAPASAVANGEDGCTDTYSSDDIYADCLEMTIDAPADSSVDCTRADSNPLGQASMLPGNGPATSSAVGEHDRDDLDAERECTFVGSRPSSGSCGGKLDRRRPEGRGGRGARGAGARRGEEGRVGGGSHSCSSAVLDITGGGSCDDDVMMSVLPSPIGATGGATSSAVAGGRYFKAGGPGDWEQEEGGLAWKMEAGESNSDDGAVAFKVPSELYMRMYPHQRIGVRWLWGLHQGDMGGVLGDDMGLGKTFQVACFLAGLFSTNQASCALVVCPKSVIRGWETELARWLVEATCRRAQVFVVASETPAKARRSAIARAVVGGLAGNGAVVITTYGMVSANPKHFAPQGSRRKWDYVILDEGHKIKNSSTRTCAAVHSLPARRRLLLTGTPVQNNLRELHTVVDWATFGGLLGAYPQFKKNFSRPIEQGQYGDASEYMVQKSRTRASELRTLLEPFLLQRTKVEIMDLKATSKTEMVVWVELSPEQREVYAAYLGGDDVKDVLKGKISSPLAAISHLKKVCLHPVVSSFPQYQLWRLDPDVSVRNLLRDSSKLAVMLEIVREACSRGNRVLVFSRFVRMLDVIQRCLEASTSEGGAGLRLNRIDGSHTDLERKSTISDFNEDESISVCLVSTGAGGTGITLTGANRVVLFDPSWNPADDMQAVDRAYRIGQKRDVIVYRMIAAGTVEEKMYEKQVFKDGLRRTIMGGSGKRKKNVRYFSRAELKQLFTLFPVGECRVLDRLEDMHGKLKDRLEAAESTAQKEIALDGHLNFICGLRGSYGASAHGDGLPKITHTAGASATGGGLSAGSGARHGPSIAEEEDESDVDEDEFGVYSEYGGTANAPPRRPARKNALEEAGLEEGGLEIVLDESDEEGSGFVHDVGADPPEDNAGAAVVAVDDDNVGRRPRRGGKDKGKCHRRLLREGSSDDNDSDDENIFVVEGGRRRLSGHGTGRGKNGGSRRERGARATGGDDDSTTGADASTAIALDVESESEIELDFGDKPGDIVDLLDDDNDIGHEERLAQSPMQSPARSAVSVASDEGFDTPGRVPMLAWSPDLTRSWACEGEGTSSSTSGCNIASIQVDPSSPVRSEPGQVGEEDDLGTGMLGASSALPMSTPISSPSEENNAVFASSPAEALEVQAGRDRARRWACDALGISPITSASPSSLRSDGGSGEDTEGDERKEGKRNRGSDANGVVADMERVRTPASGAPKMARNHSRPASGGEILEELKLRGGSFSTDGNSDASTAARLRGGRATAVDEEEEKHEDQQSQGRKRIDRGARRVFGSDVDGQEESEDGGSIASEIVARRSALGSPRPDESLSSRWDSPAASFASSDESLVDVRKRPLAAPQTAATKTAAKLATAGEKGVGGVGSLTRLEGGDVKTELAYRPLLDSACCFSTPGKGDSLPSPDRLVLVKAEEGSGDSVGPQHSDCSGYETAESTRDVGHRDMLILKGRDGSTPGASTGGNVLGASGLSASRDGQRGEQERSEAGAVGSDLDGACEQAKNYEDRCVDLSAEGDGMVEPILGPLSPVPSPSPHPSASPLPVSGSNSATVCSAHAAAAERASCRCLRCSCFVGAQGAEQAQVLLMTAWGQERAGDMQQALASCLEAIKLCDEDKELHKTIARIGSRLGWLR